MRYFFYHDNVIASFNGKVPHCSTSLGIQLLSNFCADIPLYLGIDVSVLLKCMLEFLRNFDALGKASVLSCSSFNCSINGLQRSWKEKHQEVCHLFCLNQWAVALWVVCLLIHINLKTYPQLNYFWLWKVHSKGSWYFLDGSNKWSSYLSVLGAVNYNPIRQALWCQQNFDRTTGSKNFGLSLQKWLQSPGTITLEEELFTVFISRQLVISKDYWHCLQGSTLQLKQLWLNVELPFVDEISCFRSWVVGNFSEFR